MTAERERLLAEAGRCRRTRKASVLPIDMELEQLRPLLTEKQYIYFRHYAQGMNGKEIARLYNVHPSVVSRGLTRAKQRLSAVVAAEKFFRTSRNRR